MLNRDEDDFDMPDWMKASTYQNRGPRGPLKRRGKTVQQIAEETLKKPLIPIILKEPDDGQ